ncbi:hypothetical protein HHI36_016473 [Cryptolaemus montrouzieri]|uniref:Reverse transcriptase domain-containing protein n=1 Tax=Cryptolaemus montrouzieri TaxID=559131 RepID=A0ABD2NJV1_9CUCU
MDEGEPVAALFFDLSRGFDSLNLDFMERKLCAFGFRGCTLEWLMSYLRARRFKVRVVGVISTERDGSETLASLTVKFLGVEADSTRSWRTHLGSVCKKVNCAAFALRQLRSMD